MATESFTAMSDCVYEMKWYKLSPKLQKYVVLMMMNMQKSINYRGFGIAPLNWMTFFHVRA